MEIYDTPTGKRISNIISTVVLSAVTTLIGASVISWSNIDVLDERTIRIEEELHGRLAHGSVLTDWHRDHLQSELDRVGSRIADAESGLAECNQRWARIETQLFYLMKQEE